MGKNQEKGAAKENAEKPVPRLDQMQSTSSACHFNRIPNELLENIFQYLPIEDKISARLVTPRWAAAIDREVRFSIPLTNATLPNFEAKNYKLNELKVVLNKLSIPEKFSPRMEQTFKTARSLYFMADGYVEVDSVMGSCGKIDGKGVERLLKACSNIETLTFDFSFMVDYNMISILDVSEVRFEKLTTLKVKIGMSGAVETVLLRLNTPILRNLEVERLTLDSDRRQDIFVYALVLECILRNQPTLRSLKLVDVLATAHEQEPQLEQNGMLNKLAQMNLESLEIRLMEEDTASWLAALQILFNLNSLKTLKLHTDCNNLMIVFVNFVFNHSANSLTNLELNIADRVIAFDMGNLSALLPRLTSFNLTFGHYTWFGDFPPALQHLTWNLRLTWQWYIPNLTRAQFPNLISLTIGLEALNSLAVNLLCHSLFGTPSQRTHLERITIRLNPMDPNEIIRLRVQQLPEAIYKIELNDDNILIARR